MLFRTWRRAAFAALLVASGVAVLGPASAQPVPYGQVKGPAPVPAVNPLQVSLTPAQEQTLRAALADAPRHGFEIAPRGNDQPALIAATLRYAKALRSGRLKEGNFRQDWGLRPGAFDPAPGFVRAAQEDRLADWLADLPPPYTGYDALLAALPRYREIQANGGFLPTPAIDLKQGATGPLVEALRARLAQEDPAVPTQATMAGTPPTPIFDAALTEALKRAQRRYGIQPTGALGPATRQALNVPISRRIEQIQANMERWSWMPRELNPDRIQVNIAAAVLSVFDGDEPVMSMRAVTGSPGNETPMLRSQISGIVLNPPWNVPAGIAAKELFPMGPAALKARGYRYIPLGNGSYRLQQAPGPGSALGLIKFDFANPYAVYLHDTPSKSRFASYSRLASHGCVRLEKPLALARHVLRGDPNWTPDKIDAAIASGKTIRAEVQRPMEVLLLYWTAFVTPDGTVNFRADPYGWDTLTMQRIAAQGAV